MGRGRAMGSQAATLLYLVVMVAVVVIVDWRFLRRHVWRRLAVNIGIVLVFMVVWLLVQRP
jgi:MFS-type transporter involved in bile tolerance (Atg22 family)